MTKFAYTAIDLDGSTKSGVTVARSSSAAHVILRQRGLQPLNLVEKKGLLKFEITRRLVPRKVLMHFSRQLGVFVKAGIPILDALEVIAEETTDQLFKKALYAMIEALQAGDTFAGAAAAHPEAFPRYYVGMLNSAELTGNLDIVLNQLAEYVERDLDARKRLTSAMMYPGMILGMSGVTVLVLSVVVLPRFKSFFRALNAKLPLPTRMLLAVTAFITSWWPVMALLAVGVFAGLAVAFRTRIGRARIDAVLLKLPVAGDLLRHALLERICRILSSMMRAGVSLPEAMTVTADATNNAIYRRGLNMIREEMLAGQGLAGPLARTGLFPGAARQMFRVGEETGTLDEQLQTAAAYYDRELDYKIKRFTGLFEPLVIIVMGVVVGFVALALISAMYGIYRQVKV
jgi:type IV pilus assembly protein PilC